jgi:hypothetical protein
MAATSLATAGLEGSWEVMVLLGLLGEGPAEPDADVEDDAGSEEAEGGRGDPLVGRGPCPADAVGVGGQGAVEHERDQGGEDEGEGAARRGGEPGGGPAFEQHGHDEGSADDAPAGRADRVGGGDPPDPRWPHARVGPRHSRAFRRV